MIIWLASYPGNGDERFRFLLKRCFDLNCDSDTRASSKAPWEEPELEIPAGSSAPPESWDKTYHLLLDSPGCHVIKTHGDPMDPSPSIYLTRDGRQSLYAHYCLQRHDPHNPQITLLEVVLGKGLRWSWSEHYLAWKQQPDRVVVSYADMIRGEEPFLSRLAVHLGPGGKPLPWHPVPAPELETEEWKRPLEWNDQVDEAFWAIHGEVMEELGFGADKPAPTVHEEKWLRLRQDFAQQRRLEIETHELRDRIRELEEKLDNITWVRKHYRRLRRRRRSAWRRPIARMYDYLASSHIWQPGKLVQHPPIPLVLPPVRPARLSAEQLPRLAVVIPSYQQGQFLERTLRSVLDQNYPKLQIALMDGGSQDETRDLIETYRKQLTHVQSQPDDGQAAAIQAGFQVIQGEICYWLNSDDILLPGALRLVAEYFVRHPEVDAVYGHRILINAYDQEIGRQTLPSHDPEDLWWFDTVPQETLFFRRTAWDRVQGLDTGFRFALDWDLLVRLQQSGSKIVRLPFFLGCFRVHDQQKTLTQIKSVGEPEMNRIRERVLGSKFNEVTLHRIYTRHRALCALQAHLEQWRAYRKLKNFFWALR